MKRLKVILIFLIIILTSCGSQTVFEEYHTFEKQSWNKFKLLPFEFDVNSISGSYAVYMIIRYNRDFPQMTLSFNSELIGPDGEQRRRSIDIKLKDQHRNLLGADQSDYYEIKYPLYPDFKFNTKGICIIEFQNEMKKYETAGLIQIGLLVEHH